MSENYFIIIVVAVLLIGERLFPRNQYAFFNIERKRDSFWMILNQFLIPGFLSYITYLLFQSLSLAQTPMIHLHQLSYWAQFLIVFLLFDFVNFIIHLMLHKVPFLWPLHQLHHSTTELTILSSFRHLWAERTIYFVFFVFLWRVIQADKTILMINGLIFATVCVIQHANIKFKLWALLDYIIVTPHNHLWHHATESKFRGGQNFGFALSIWDRLIGTYYVPQSSPDAIGLKENNFPRTIIKQLVYPFNQIFKIKL